jgi:hypothetical protein
MGIRASKTKYSGLSDVQIEELLKQPLLSSDLKELSNITELEKEITQRINNSYSQIHNSLSVSLGALPLSNNSEKQIINKKISEYKKLLDSLVSIKSEVEHYTAKVNTRGGIQDSFKGGRRKSKKVRSKRRRYTVRK